MGGEYWMVWVKEKESKEYPIVYTADQLQAERSKADENRFWLTKYEYRRRVDKYQQSVKKVQILEDIEKELGESLAGEKSWDLAYDNVADNYASNLPTGILSNIPKDHKRGSLGSSLFHCILPFLVLFSPSCLAHSA